MMRKIFILIVIDLCIQCRSHPNAHDISRRAIQRRGELPPEPTTISSTTPTVSSTAPTTSHVSSPITPAAKPTATSHAPSSITTTVTPTVSSPTPTNSSTPHTNSAPASPSPSHPIIYHTPPTTSTAPTTTESLGKRTPIPKRKPEIGAYPVSSLGALAAPELQWHAAIYEKIMTPYRQICGGTVVARDAVISAAHCFYTDDGGAQRPALFAVAAGKLLRAWDASDDYAQKSDVKSIHIPARYRGGATHYQADLALVRLTNELQYAPGVQPACISFDPALEETVLQKDNAGTITGFGLVSENGEPSPQLTVLDLPYIDIEECFRKVDVSFVKFLTSDKICAGYWDAGKALCRGDSGGGLIYTAQIKDSWQTAPFIFGIASTAYRDKNQCNAFTPASFTNPLAHRNFLEQLVPELEDECKYAYLGVKREIKRGNKKETQGRRKPVNLNPSLVSARNSTRRVTPLPTRRQPGIAQPTSETLQASVSASTSVTPPTSVAAPTSVNKALQSPGLEWYAGVYDQTVTPYAQICGASIVKRDVVISAAHCFWSGEGLRDASQFKVAAGKLLQPWDAFEDISTRQESDVDAIIVPPSYLDAALGYQGDIAVLRLRGPLRYGAAARPACVSFDAALHHDAFNREDSERYLMTTGWAIARQLHAPSGRLRYVELPVTEAAQCRTELQPDFRKYLSRDKVCVGFMSTAMALCEGDLGGGLIHYANITNSSKTVPFLHGVASTIEKNGQKCAVPVLAPASFTRLFSHKEFLEEHIPQLEEECGYVYLGEPRPEDVEAEAEKRDEVTTEGRGDLTVSVPAVSQAAPHAQGTSDNVLVTVVNGTIRISVTAVNSVMLELKP